METQKVFKITENRRFIRQQIPVEGEVAIDRPGMKGWLRFREFIGKVEGLKRFGFIPDNPRVMVISDRDGYPISPYRPSLEEMKKQCKADGDQEMADRQANYQLTKDKAEEKAHWYYSSMALAIMGIVFVTLVLIVLATSGKLGAIK